MPNTISAVKTLEQIKKEVSELLWGGKPSQARARIDEACAVFEHNIKELRALLPDSDQDEDEDEDEGEDEDEEVLDGPEEKKRERREFVLDLAKKLAPASGSQLSVLQLLKSLKAESYDLGVPENRRATAVSSILSRSGKYNKIGKGIYIRV